MTAERHEGYVLDLDYTKSITPKLSPLEIDFVLTQRGVAVPRENNDRKRYCELGCGHGYTTVLLAVMDPDTDYLGIDLNPTHIASARELAVEAGADNVRFLEGSFQNALEEDLGPFDWIVLHGVLSWVSENVEEQIGEFIKAFLRPGGRVFVDYNAMPGKNQLDPLRWMLTFFEGLSSNELPLEERARESLEHVLELFKRKADVFTQNARLARATQKLANQPVNYLVHEYLHEHWRSHYFIQLARRYGELGLSFVGSTSFRDNVDEYRFTMPMLSHLNTFKDPLIREQVADFYRNTAFRRDVYCSELKTMSREERLDAWRNACFGFIRPAEKVHPELVIPSGRVSLDRPVFWETVESLKQGPKRMGDIEHESRHSGEDIIRMALLPLLATNQVKPMAEPSKRTEEIKTLNTVLARKCLDGEEVKAMGTNRGVALPLPLFEQAYIALKDGIERIDEDLLSGVMSVLKSHNRTLTGEDGKLIQDEDHARNRLHELLDEFERDKHPLYASLGVL